MTSPRRIARHHKVLLPVLGAVTLVLLGAAIGSVVLLSGAFTTAATKQHFRLTHRILDLGLMYSVRGHTDNINTPRLDDPALIRQGLSCYRLHCEQCHGGPGVAPSEMAQGMMPIPSGLAQSAQDWSAENLYYITRKGIRMTGMPAWEYRLSEQSLWSTIAFLKTLPTLTREDYLPPGADNKNSLACESREDLPSTNEPDQGDVLLRQYACHACHIIDSVIGPRTHIGPPLTQWSRRGYIAGVLPNTRENLTHWIQSPREVSPQTLMPDLNVPAAHAAVMADFLFKQK